MAQKKVQPDYQKLRQVLIEDFGKECADQFSENDLESLGDFILACVSECEF